MDRGIKDEVMIFTQSYSSDTRRKSLAAAEMWLVAACISVCFGRSKQSQRSSSKSVSCKKV